MFFIKWIQAVYEQCAVEPLASRGSNYNCIRKIFLYKYLVNNGKKIAADYQPSKKILKSKHIRSSLKLFTFDRWKEN